MRQLTSLINQVILARSITSMASPRSPLANYVGRDTRTNQRVVTTGTGSAIATQYISNSEPGKVFVVSDGNYIDQRPA